MQNGCVNIFPLRVQQETNTTKHEEQLQRSSSVVNSEGIYYKVP